MLRKWNDDEDKRGPAHEPELEAEPQVRGAQARHQPEKAGGSGLKKRQRNFQRKESSLKAKRPKLSFLSSANANKRYSCHICDGTFHLRAQLKNHIENGQHEMDQSDSSTSTTTASLANQNESLEDFLKRYERRWFEVNGEFVQERESNSDPTTSEENLDDNNLEDDDVWIQEKWN